MNLGFIVKENTLTDSIFQSSQLTKPLLSILIISIFHLVNLDPHTQKGGGGRKMGPKN